MNTLQGFDVNQPLTAVQACNFKDAGYAFCIRYLPRTAALIQGNLTAAEITILHGAGLAIGAVQHVAEPGWQPSAALGSEYGLFAASYAEMIGIPKGINLWCDLEDVAGDSTVQDVIDYCTSWFKSVQGSGYDPGLYCGWNMELDPQQLYDLPFKHYWKAYNYDDGVATRGFQLIQHPQQTLEGITYDPNISQPDELGDSAIFWNPS